MAAVSPHVDAAAQADFSHAVARHLAGDVAAARRGYEQVLARDPDHAEACNNLASILAGAGDEERAERLLQHAVGVDTNYGEAHNNLGLIWSARGEHARALAAFERAVALEGSRAGWCSNLGNAYVELFRFSEAAVAFDRAIALDANDPDVWSNRALALRGLQRPDDAIESLRRALSLAPAHLNALSNLAIILKEAKRLDEAESLLAKATAIDPANPKLWCNYAAIFEARGQYARVRELAEHARTLDPSYAEIYNLLANAEMEAGRYAESIALYEQALALEPNNSNANWNIGLLWLLHGDFARGWKQFEWRKRLQSAVLDRGEYAGKEWDGAPLAGRDILLHSEQGVGDAFQFVRYAAELKARGARRVYLECPYPIVPLLSGVRGLDAVVARGVPLPAFDVHASLMSLPGLLGTTLDSIPAAVPYIPVEPRTITGRVSAPEGTVKVGFVWAGNPLHGRDFHRSAPLASFRALAGVEGTRFFSLQKGDAPERALAERPIEGVVDLAADLVDFRDTAAVLQALDLVITVDTSVAHLAGALGRPTWLLLPHVPDFRWMLGRSDSPWYPTMRIFRQPAPRDWTSVFAEVQAALRARVAEGETSASVDASCVASGHDRDTDAIGGVVDDNVVTLSSAARVSDGRPRFDLYTPLASLADPRRFAEYEAELVGNGHDVPVRTFLDEYLDHADALVDLTPGLGTCVLSAATAPRPPRTISVVERDDAEAARLVQLVARRASLVTVVRATDARAAMRERAPDAGGRLVVRAGEGTDLARTVDAVGSTEPERRPAVIAWSRLVPNDASGALAFLESLGYVTVALSAANGEASLDAIDRPAAAQSLLSISHAALDAMEERAAFEQARTSSGHRATSAAPIAVPAPIQVSIAVGGAPTVRQASTTQATTPSSRPGAMSFVVTTSGAPAAPVAPAARISPSAAVASARTEIGIDWQLRGDSGWGVYGTNLALELERAGTRRPAIFAADTGDLSAVARFRLDRALREGEQRGRVMQGSASSISFEGVMLRALGNNCGHGPLWERITARRNAGVIFFEDAAFDAGALQRARSLDLIVAGSHWNEAVLRAAGLDHVTTVLQGIDPTIFHPAPSSGLLSDHFVIFSGGKLEYRKGQDLVVAAFRAFRGRHPDALLLTAWHNNWPQLVADLDLAGHVRGTPRVIDGRLDVTTWLTANGVPAEAVLDVGRTPNALMGQVVREANVALFPNRCEGGTNLVAMECMAAGIPTIVANNSGQRDLVATGGTFPLDKQRDVRSAGQHFRSTEGWGESDVDEIVEALEIVYSDRTRAASIARQGAEALATMSWQQQVGEFLRALSPLL